MDEFIGNYVRGCRKCQMAKKRNIRGHGKLQPLPVLEGPWQWTESDLIAPLPPSRGRNVIYVVVDRFTKYTYFIPCTNRETAQSLAKLHERHVWSQEGLPKIHLTDRGPQFRAEFTGELYKSLGIEQRLSTAYHLQTQGQVESLNGWLETYLRMFIDHRQDDWIDHLHKAQFAWNNHYHSTIGMTPFFASKVRHPTFTDIPSMTQGRDERLRTRVDTDTMVTQMIESSQEAQKKDSIPGRTQPPPPPILVRDFGAEEPEEHYRMKQYLDSRWIKTRDNKWQFQFLVEWDGYNDHTWEPREQIEKDSENSKQELGEDERHFDMEEDFYNKHPNAPKHINPEGDRFEWFTQRSRRKGKTPIQ